MLNIVLFGPPGAGKGTQASILTDHYQLVHLSTGDIFRANIKGETELGKMAKTFIDKGELVPDEVTINMLNDEVEKHPDAKGFIFDGFPRTTAQAEALDTFLATKNTGITMMLALEVDKQELINRLLERGKTSGRSDDADQSIIENRISEYEAKTAPLKSFYAGQSKFVGIDGMGTIEEISERLFFAVDEQSVA